MPVERPTFIESWYRVSDLTPQLLAAVQVQRQHFRGHRWYILQNPASNEYFRLSAPAYHFTAMLDGRRTVNEVWRICMERFGDAAPTQGEVVDVLSRLYGANLLQGDVAPDAEELFQRHRKKRWREVRGLLTNFYSSGFRFGIRMNSWADGLASSANGSPSTDGSPGPPLWAPDFGPSAEASEI